MPRLNLFISCWIFFYLHLYCARSSTLPRVEMKFCPLDYCPNNNIDLNSSLYFLHIDTEFRMYFVSVSSLFRAKSPKIPKNFAKFRVAKLDKIWWDSVYCSKSSVFCRKWKNHFRGHPSFKWPNTEPPTSHPAGLSTEADHVPAKNCCITLYSYRTHTQTCGDRTGQFTVYSLYDEHWTAFLPIITETCKNRHREILKKRRQQIQRSCFHKYYVRSLYAIS